MTPAGAATMKTGCGLEFLVDADMVDDLSRFKWSKAVRGKQTYIFCQKIKTYLHRYITRAPKGLQVDHINGDPRDNRRHNLRLCTKDENNRNARNRRPSSSGYRGVEKCGPTFRAKIRFDNVVYSSSQVSTKEEAANIYDAMAKKYHGEFAVLNFPDRTPRSTE